MGSGDLLSRDGRGNPREREGPLGPDCGAGTDPRWNRTTQRWAPRTRPAAILFSTRYINPEKIYFSLILLTNLAMLRNLLCTGKVS
ncbi:hypothetical protein NDU88_004757 [Pleurodeles waltl]|uniref:Uncharacterized protein n=1 Tax=Pleurodeles waltl TaxID=8319 RepID=A0AAV7TSE7_PLEWA|nr:hypothetical protein NDU88_004757 [Pleurodeles waltl]